ncbi:uncharacterized protein MAM_02112 [Metarhizium album ARSEF 1941]|uniref:Uncharacterized protein n=1 Tax=Metarhizium album (strain ARSEF 1941) TaxID=1081103 RepID=A0A0B2X1J8_METAS|nr:uncharacterized protein MAM_02112 [Metarhizium album ARSEF 1941]KHO00189.1 hypothetical protein MAM_02112 [Metarhizium album ARSEF 1941]
MLMMQISALREFTRRLGRVERTMSAMLETAQSYLERFHNAMDAEDVGGFHQPSDEE